MSSDRFLARSMLFLPAGEGRFIEKAPQRGADLIVLDLEDGVARSGKARARESLSASTAQLQRAGCVVYVRVNKEAQLMQDDLTAAVAAGADGLVLPKVETSGQLVHFDEAVSRAEVSAARKPASVKLIVLIETPTGVCNAAEIARGSPRVVALCFGPEDFATEMGIPPTREGLAWPAQAVAIAAVAMGVEPLGMAGSVSDFSDVEAYRDLAFHARSIGVRGGVCIHPAQIQVLNEVFSGSEAEAKAAERIVTAFDKAQADGMGSIALDGRMIDEPIAKRARLFLQRRQSFRQREAPSPRGGGTAS
jgi:citrate lyase subunit beta/citryl-CoA lyase